MSYVYILWLRNAVESFSKVLPIRNTYTENVRGVSTNFPSLGRLRVNKMHKVSCLCEKETWDQWHHCKPGHEDPRTPSPRIANFVQNSTKLFAREGKFVETPRSFQTQLPVLEESTINFEKINYCVRKLEKLFIFPQGTKLTNPTGSALKILGISLWTLPEKGSCICKLRVTCTFCGYLSWC